MSFSNKYNKDCGCNDTSKSTRRYGSSSGSCCNDPVQQSPASCCPEPETIHVFGNCLRPTCSVVASSDDFFLKFANLNEKLPIDGNVTFFYHAAAGFMRIIGMDNYGSYQLSLMDKTKAGAVIGKDDCVTFEAVPPALSASTSKCLVGKFKAPALNADETIYIENGTAIPVGSTLTFTANGQTGSYNVTEFLSASDTTYAYTVENTGNGHIPGTIFDGGCTGICTIPVEIITDVDLCDLTDTVSSTSLIACLNGSPRAQKSSGENDILIGDGAGGWKLSKLSSTECCIILDGTLKFSGNACTDAQDTVKIKDINIECFLAYWQAVKDNNTNPSGTVSSAQTKLPMNIDGFDIVVVDYDPTNKLITFKPISPVNQSQITFEAGTQVCMGEACKNCLNGSRFTNYFTFGGGDQEISSLYGVNSINSLKYEQGVRHRYLVGYQHNVAPFTSQTLELSTGYDDGLAINQVKPLITDPLLYRMKICNNSLTGCDQFAEINYNYQLIFNNLPAGVRVHWAIGSVVGNANTLEDNTTPNPFITASSQSDAAGYVDGPSHTDAVGTIGDTNIGFGNRGSLKAQPFIAGFFNDYAFLEHCNCALNIVWYYVELEVLPGVTIATGFVDNSLATRVMIKYSDANLAPMPRNDSSSEGFNA
jgi:hypothetical protein